MNKANEKENRPKCETKSVHSVVKKEADELLYETKNVYVSLKDC